MSIIINLVACSSKQNDQLIDFETSHIVELVDNGSIEISKEKNQVGHYPMSGTYSMDFLC